MVQLHFLLCLALSRYTVTLTPILLPKLPHSDVKVFLRKNIIHSIRPNLLLLHPTGTRLSLDAIKRRVQMSNRFAKKEDKDSEKKPPLFMADIVLSLPTVMMRPSLEDIQSTLNKAVQVMLKMSENIPQWEHLVNQQRLQQKVGHNPNIIPWLCPQRLLREN